MNPIAKTDATNIKVFSTIKSECKENQYEGLKHLLGIITNKDFSFSRSFITRNADRCIELVELMTNSRKNKAITEELLLKTMLQFYQHTIFVNNANLVENFTITCNDGKNVAFDPTLLKHSSANFYHFIKKNSNQINYDSECLLVFKEYLISHTYSKYPLKVMLNTYKLACVHEWNDLATRTKKTIINLLSIIADKKGLLDFFEQLDNLSISKTIKTEFEFNALTSYLNNHNYQTETSHDNTYLNLPAKNMMLLEEENVYGERLRVYVNGFVISDDKDLAAALLFDFMPKERREIIKEIVLKTESVEEYLPFLKSISNLFSALSSFTMIYTEKVSKEFDSMHLLESCQIIQRHSDVQILIKAKNLDLLFNLKDYQQFANMQTIKTTCEIDLQLFNAQVKPKNFAKGTLFANHDWVCHDTLDAIKGSIQYTLKPL